MQISFYCSFAVSQFRKSVTAMGQQKNANLFHHYVGGNIFKIATAKKVQEFDFTSFECDNKVIRFIQIAMDILRQNLPQQIFLFDEVHNPDCTNKNLPTGSLKNIMPNS
jgi:adenylyl- and sulfurtransferase ThiI